MLMSNNEQFAQLNDAGLEAEDCFNELSNRLVSRDPIRYFGIR